MSRQLPPNPSLIQLKHQAKELLKAHRSGESDVCMRIKVFHPRFSGASESEVRDARISLADAQLVLAREYGFSSWAKLRRHVEESSETPHEIILGRINQLISERTENAAKVIRRMLQDDPQRVGVIMIALGQETTAGVMKYLSDAEIEEIAVSITQLDVVTTEQEDRILEEFEQLLVAGKYVSRGGIDYARGALEKALGPRKARALLRRIRARHEVVVGRVSKLISERPGDAARILMQSQPGEAAILVHALGQGIPQEVADHLSDVQAERIAQYAVERDETAVEEEVEALEAFEQLLVALKYVMHGGIPFARGALEKAMGPRKTRALLDRAAGVACSGFLMMDRMDPDRIVSAISAESPQTIAQVLSQLESSRAIAVFSGLPEGLRTEVASLIARGKRAAPDALRELDERLGHELAAP